MPHICPYFFYIYIYSQMHVYAYILTAKCHVDRVWPGKRGSTRQVHAHRQGGPTSTSLPLSSPSMIQVDTGSHTKCFWRIAGVWACMIIYIFYITILLNFIDICLVFTTVCAKIIWEPHGTPTVCFGHFSVDWTEKTKSPWLMSRWGGKRILLMLVRVAFTSVQPFHDSPTITVPLDSGKRYLQVPIHLSSYHFGIAMFLLLIRLLLEYPD